jgi:FtsZ-binding cell division protein ZapB
VRQIDFGDWWGSGLFPTPRNLVATANDPDQRPHDTQRWRESMGAFLRREGWHESQPTGFTKAERVNLMHILARLDEVQAYRTRLGQTKGEQKLQRHNNPSQVWRAFLKDIGELKTKEGGKKSTLKESVADLQEENDHLREENARLKDEFASDDWEEKLKAIVIKNDATELASAIWDADEATTSPAVNLTGAMINEYQKAGSILEIVDLDPTEHIRHNSQKARQYADAILNQLDGQTDEPNDERLARRIVNARGPAAAQSLAQAIVALIQKRIDPEESEQPAAEPVAGHPQDATQASVEGVSEVEEDEAAIAERLAASMTDAEKIAAKERLDEIMAQAEKGNVLVAGAGYHLGNVPADDPRATTWNVAVYDPVCSAIKAFSPREVAEAKAEIVRQFPIEVRTKALLYDPGHPSYPTLDGDAEAQRQKNNAEVSAEVNRVHRLPVATEEQLLEWVGVWLRENPPETRRFDAPENRPDLQREALVAQVRRWIVEEHGAQASGLQIFTAIRKHEPLGEPPTDTQEPEKKKRGPKPKPKLDEFGRPARPEIGDKHIGESGVVEIFVASDDGRKRGEWVVQKGETVQPGEAPWPPPPQEAPRMGQKRVIGKCRDSYFPASPADPPGSVERYFIEVYQATDAMPQGAWILCGGDGRATHDEAAKFL